MPDRNASKLKIGIMGGTFDPIHLGHLVCAESVCTNLRLDKVIFIPAGNPSFKQARDLASGQDRFEMCALACASNERFEVSRIELDRQGITYTSDTMRELNKLYPDADIFFILGSDSALTLHLWHEGSLLMEQAQFAILMRPGDDRVHVERYIADHAIDATLVDCPLLDISSSAIRERCAQGQSIRYLTPDDVGAYIEKQALYGCVHGA